MDVLKAQLFDSGEIGKGSPAALTASVLREGATSTSASGSALDRLDIQPLDLAAALKILVLEVLESLDQALERALQSSEPPDAGARSQLVATPLVDGRPPTPQPPAGSVDSRSPAAGSSGPPVGRFAPQAPLPYAPLIEAEIDATEITASEITASADDLAELTSAAILGAVGSAAAASTAAAGAAPSASAACPATPSPGIPAPPAVPSPAGSSSAVPSPAGSPSEVPSPAVLTSAGPSSGVSTAGLRAAGTVAVGSGTAACDPPPLRPAAPGMPRGISPSASDCGIRRAALPASMGVKSGPLDVRLIQRSAAPATATQAARLVIQLFLRSLPPVETDPTLDLAGLERVEADVGNSLERGLVTVGAWHEVPEAVVAEAELAGVLVQQVLREDPAAAAWLRSEWPGLATPLQRFWRRRRFARKARNEWDDQPESDPGTAGTGTNPEDDLRR